MTLRGDNFKRVSLGENVEKIVIKYFLKSSAFRINVCRTVAKFHAKGSVLETTERRQVTY